MSQQSPAAPGRWTFTLSRNSLTLAVAFWLMLTMNGRFWNTVWTGVGGWSNENTWFLISLPLFVLCWL
jgi:lipid A ethanolaminephosphotransferase